MSRIQNTMITKDDIVDYVDKMKIKKSNIGGLDRIDVYMHIQELIRMYGDYAEQELSKQKETLDKQQQELEASIAREKTAREELDTHKSSVHAKEQQFEKQIDQIAGLMKYQELAAGLQVENEAKKQEIRELKKSNDLLPELQEKADELHKKVSELSDELDKSKAYAKDSEDLAERFRKENEGFQKENEELKKTKELLPELESRTTILDNKAKELNEELEQSKGYAQKLEEETQMQKIEIHELQQYKNQAITLQNEVQRQKSEAEEQHQFKETVSQLQREKQEQEQRIEKLQTETHILRKEIEGLQKPGVFSEAIQEELESRTKEILELKEEIQDRTVEAQAMKNELQGYQTLLKDKEEFYTGLIRKLEPVKGEENSRKDSLVSASEDIQQKLSEQEQVILKQEQKIHDILQELDEKEQELGEKEQELKKLKEKENAVQSVESYSYMQEIGEILREARREGQSIIDNARVEAEQEMIKLLNLRAKYKQENEVYRNWCKRVESEKKSVEEFLKQLSVQYDNVNRGFSSVKDEAASFDIKKIFRVIDMQQINAEEADYEEKGLV